MEVINVTFRGDAKSMVSDLTTLTAIGSLTYIEQIKSGCVMDILHITKSARRACVQRTTVPHKYFCYPKGGSHLTGVLMSL